MFRNVMAILPTLLFTAQTDNSVSLGEKVDMIRTQSENEDDDDHFQQ